MKNSLYIAWKYISHNKIKTLTLIACVSIILILPISLEIILNESEVQLLSRADDTPLVVGDKGSRSMEQGRRYLKCVGWSGAIGLAGA